MATRASLSRSLIATTRSSLRSPTLAARRPSPPIAGPRVDRSRFSFASPRSFAELGCAQSFFPLHSVVAGARLTSHLSVSARACCELSHGT